MKNKLAIVITKWQAMTFEKKLFLIWISALVILPLLTWGLYRWDFALAVLMAILTSGIYCLKRQEEDEYFNGILNRS